MSKGLPFRSIARKKKVKSSYVMDYFIKIEEATLQVKTKIKKLLLLLQLLLKAIG